MKSISKMVVGTGLVMTMLCADAFAGGRGGDMHYYRGDHWCRSGWFGLSVAVTALTIGALVEALPPRHTTVIVGNEPYYYYDGAYFRPAPSGYVVVPAPVVVQQAAPVVVQQVAPVVVAPPASTVVATEGSSVVTVNIPNAKGSYTPVTLSRSGTGFLGPQGEYYPEFPKVEQLRLMYGK